MINPKNRNNTALFHFEDDSMRAVKDMPNLIREFSGFWNHRASEGKLLQRLDCLHQAEIPPIGDLFTVSITSHESHISLGVIKREAGEFNPEFQASPATSPVPDELAGRPQIPPQRSPLE